MSESCVRSGTCCHSPRFVHCPFSKPNPKSEGTPRCLYLVPLPPDGTWSGPVRYQCARYMEIATGVAYEYFAGTATLQNVRSKSPAFGAGCCVPNLDENPRRKAILRHAWTKQDPDVLV